MNFKENFVRALAVKNIAGNGFGLGEGRELELQMFKISTNDR